MTRSPNPHLVLLAAVLFPGVGHVLIGQASRGLVFASFTVLLGLLTTPVAPPEASFMGQHAGGFFVWALSIPDAYRRARLARSVGAFRGDRQRPALGDTPPRI
jgi:hypothetical protein